MIAVSYSKKDFVSKMQKENITDTTVEDTNDYYICIDSTGGPDSEPYFKQFHPNVLNLCFDDVSTDSTNWGEDIKDYYTAVAPTLTQIQHISNFLHFEQNFHKLLRQRTRKKLLGLREQSLQSRFHRIFHNFFFIKEYKKRRASFVIIVF